MNFIELTEEKLDVTDVSEKVAHESCGAVSMFVGITRDNFEDKKVLSLKYEAYDKMAYKMMNKICDDIREKWEQVKHIAIYHRLGIVPIKESSVVIAISSPHRQDSLEAVQFAIDELKRTVPIWKKEVYGGSYEDRTSQPRKRVKRVKSHVNFDICCPINNEVIVPKNLLQIRADELEIRRRITCFIGRKRDEINSNNLQDFITETKPNDESEMTCARVNSTVYRIKGAKSHVKVHRVKNETGPQSMNYTNALDKLMENTSPVKIKPDPDGEDVKPVIAKLPNGIEERIGNAESFLNIPTKNVPTKNLFERLKRIEDRILYLETLSPEYLHFINDPSGSANIGPFPIKKEPKKVYSTSELEDLIKKLEQEK